MSSSTKKLEVKFLSPQEAAEIEERQIESLIASIKDSGIQFVIFCRLYHHGG